MLNQMTHTSSQIFQVLIMTSSRNENEQGHRGMYSVGLIVCLRVRGKLSYRYAKFMAWMGICSYPVSDFWVSFGVVLAGVLCI